MSLEEAVQWCVEHRADARFSTLAEKPVVFLRIAKWSFWFSASSLPEAVAKAKARYDEVMALARK